MNKSLTFVEVHTTQKLFAFIRLIIIYYGANLIKLILYFFQLLMQKT